MILSKFRENISKNLFSCSRKCDKKRNVLFFYEKLIYINCCEKCSTQICCCVPAPLSPTQNKKRSRRPIRGHIYTHTLTHSHTHTLVPSHTHTLIPSHTYNPTYSHPHILTHSHTHTLTHSHPHILTHPYTPVLTHSHPHILTHSHTHTLTHLHPNIIIHSYTSLFIPYVDWFPSSS